MKAGPLFWEIRKDGTEAAAPINLLAVGKKEFSVPQLS